MATFLPYWQSPRIRLRPMHRDDVDLWLVEEQEDGEATHFLNAGTPLPKSRHVAEVFATKHAEFASAERRHTCTRGAFEDELCFGLTREEFDVFEARPPAP